MAPIRLHMRNIGKSFGGIPVLQQAELSLQAGQVVALLGSNGAGKSTLVKILCGAYQRDSGTVHLDGEAVEFTHPQHALAHGVRLLPQEISVLPHLSVAENICIDALPYKRRLGMHLVDRPTMRRQSRRLLDQLGLDIDPDSPVHRLSPPQQRIVEIARALAGKARVLVMDEPTAALTEPEAQRLFASIARLKDQGVSIVYISHYLDEVFAVADQIAVLRDGRNAGLFAAPTATRRQVLTAMLGDDLQDLYPPPATTAPTARLLSVENLRVAGALHGVDLTAYSGRITGVFGLLGSGAAQLGRALFGALGPLPEGHIALDGRPYRPHSPRRGVAQGLAFVAAERQREGIVPDLSVNANTTLPFLDRFRRGGVLSAHREQTHTTHWLKSLAIQTQGGQQAIRFLSGGNQQKVCLARWLDQGVRLLILEEPTRGVDLGARRSLYAQLRAQTEAGLAVLLISSDAEEIAGLGDDILVLDRGRPAAHFNHGATPAQLLEAASGGKES
ncbi:MAG: ATP-binding cassette domain-containing protein [Candidatus Latescibacteria bacterium]|nr:ATP-binding cassette domain-containing protein [Candidatus Latescibacterota bacterium]